MISVVSLGLIFLAGLVLLARRSAASAHAPQLVLGVLPLALLFVPVQLLQGLWQLLAGFREIARTREDQARAMLAMSIEHHRIWSLGSWLVVAALVLACIAQGLGLRFGAAQSSPRASDARPGWADWMLVLSPVMDLPIAFVADVAQRIEATVMGFITVNADVEPPGHIAAWVAGLLDPQQLGRVIGTDATLAMMAAAMLICALLGVATANAAMRRAREPWPWLTAYDWVVMCATCGLAAISALRLHEVAEWGERSLRLLPAP
jgi:hypothetical protein